MTTKTSYQLGADAFVYALFGLAGACGFLGGLCGVAALAAWARRNDA